MIFGLTISRGRALAQVLAKIQNTFSYSTKMHPNRLHCTYQNWFRRCRSFKKWIYVWRSFGDHNLLLAAPVLAFLAFFLQIWLLPKIVRLETLQSSHKIKNCKQKKIFAEKQPLFEMRSSSRLRQKFEFFSWSSQTFHSYSVARNGISIFQSI